MKCRKSSGFTLIELLVVIAIIIILASILFPVFASIREKGRQTQCLSNLRQLGYAMHCYLGDWEKYPGAGEATSTGGNWVPGDSLPIRIDRGVLYPYIKTDGLFVCLSDPDRFTTGLSFRMNQQLAWETENSPARPSDTVMLIESPVVDACFRIGGASASTPMPPYDPGLNKADQVPTPINTVHLDQANVLFVDGHVKGLESGQVTAEMFDLE